MDALMEGIAALLPHRFVAHTDPHGDHAVVAGTDYQGWTMDGLLDPLLISVGKELPEAVFGFRAVTTGPGISSLTAMESARSSRAAERTREATAALDAE